MPEPADVIIAKSLFTQLDGDPDVDEVTGGWLPYATRALADLYDAGWRVTAQSGRGEADNA